jgi:hypothetical protein
VLRMPGDSLWPLILALALCGLFAALLFKLLLLTSIAGAASMLAMAGWLWPTRATFPPPVIPS